MRILSVPHEGDAESLAWFQAIGRRPVRPGRGRLAGGLMPKACASQEAERGGGHGEGPGPTTRSCPVAGGTSHDLPGALPYAGWKALRLLSIRSLGPTRRAGNRHVRLSAGAHLQDADGRAQRHAPLARHARPARLPGADPGLRAPAPRSASPRLFRTFDAVSNRSICASSRRAGLRPKATSANRPGGEDRSLDRPRGRTAGSGHGGRRRNPVPRGSAEGVSAARERW
jgi:hypothetical protein